MKAYQGIISKEEFIKELEWHYEQDNFVQGQYFEDGRGCAVGCSLESISRKKNLEIELDDHAQYPKLLGIPEWLARLEDTIFEGLYKKDAKEWPLRFSKAIEPGQDLEKIKAPFIVYVLESNLERLQDERFKEQKAAVERCINLWQRDDLYSDEWERERSAARSAAWYAWSTESAAESAWYTGSAAESAAWYTGSAAWSTESVAESTSGAVGWSVAWSARSAAWSSRSAAYKSFADKLIELIKESE